MEPCFSKMGKRINYITNLHVADFSGGWSGMNHHVYRELNSRLEINVVEGVNPPYLLTEKISSKLFRMMQLKGKFPAFTAARLNKISKEVNDRLHGADFNFFHGVTPWLNVSNAVPYALYLDACFATYINIYHNSNQFSKRQLNSLFKSEASFLQKAKAVFFSSEWSMNDARHQYQLDGSNFFVAGLGGGFNVGLPEQPNELPYFLFVGLDFYGKGGDKVINAFTKIRQTNPDFGLKIVGQKPPDPFLKNCAIEYLGFIDKSSKKGFEKMASLFAGAYAFILPTSKDITPLVLIESASMGCPAISTKAFGIPEIVKHGETGLLIDTGASMETQLENAMRQLCDNIELRNRLGKNAETYIQSNFTWKKTGAMIATKIMELL
jgi:glycosyltransferase involved in cell wall biosynthesis